MAKKKKDSWGIAKQKATADSIGRQLIEDKEKKISEIKRKVSEERKKELALTTKMLKEELKEKEVKRKMIRIGEDHHEKAKFNKQRMQLQKYIERLIELDEEGKVDWD